MTAVARRPLPLHGRLPALRTAGPHGAGAAAGLVALVALSGVLRTRALGAPFWGDEALTVGIAAHPLAAIPGELRLDGSPPLFYLLLHGWMALAGHSERGTHVLPLVFALATVPVGWWLGRTLFGAAAGWAVAALAALDPMLTAYAQETRMYSLAALLALVASGAFVAAFLQRRRHWPVVFGLSLAALLYTHDWGLYVVAGALTAFAVLLAGARERRSLLRDGLVGFGLAAVLFAPWVPTLVYQARHTGAPWAPTPHLRALLRAIRYLAGSWAAAGLLLVAAVAAAARWRERRDLCEARAALVLLALAAGTLLPAFAVAHLTGAWAGRYLIVLLGPLLLAAGLTVARAGATGLAVLAVLATAWAPLPATADLMHKSNAKHLAAEVAPLLRPGDLVVGGHPEALPVIRYYLGPRLRYANLLGPVREPAVMDWRDALARLRRTGPAPVLALARRLPAGARLAYFAPLTTRRWRAPWTRLVRIRARELARALAADPALRRVERVRPGRHGTLSTLRATIYVRR